MQLTDCAGTLDPHISTSALSRHATCTRGVTNTARPLTAQFVLQIHLGRCFVSFLCAGSLRGTSPHESDNIDDGLHHQLREHFIRDHLPSLHTGHEERKMK